MKTLSLPWISIVIPIKDERDNIPLLASQLLKFFEVRPESEVASFELVFVDDGSTDGSESLLDEIGLHDVFLHWLSSTKIIFTLQKPVTLVNFP